MPHRIKGNGRTYPLTTPGDGKPHDLSSRAGSSGRPVRYATFTFPAINAAGVAQAGFVLVGRQAAVIPIQAGGSNTFDYVDPGEIYYQDDGTARYVTLDCTGHVVEE